MDHVKILKRAWHIIAHYRALWLFGTILALTTASWGRSGISRSSGSSSGQSAPSQIDLGNGFFAQRWAEVQHDLDALNQSLNDFLSHDPVPTLITIGIIAAVIVLILIVISIIARYVSETALIKMVDQYENSGEAGSIRQGLRLGWSRATWRMFLLSLLVDVPSALVFLLALVLALSPLLLLILGGTALSIIGVVAAVGLFFLMLFAAIIAGEILGLLKTFAYRACALGGLGVIDALGAGYAMLRQHLKDVGLMWLITLGIRIGWPIAMFPIGVILLIVAGIAGVVTAVLAGLIAGLLTKGLALLLIVIAAGTVVFVLLLGGPLAFLNGLQLAYLSTTWTLTYRELRSLDDLASEAAG
jgi:hypothetical protein